MFIDEAKVTVQSGPGGDGIVHFRREKFVPRGGPDGGDGGKGGDVVFVVNPHVNTLFAFRNQRIRQAEDGGKGGISKMTGRSAKDLIIEVYNEAGQVAVAYKVYRCWVSKFSALPELDANANAVAIESITLVHEGWERDLDVTEPVEPSYEKPE